MADQASPEGRSRAVASVPSPGSAQSASPGPVEGASGAAPEAAASQPDDRLEGMRLVEPAVLGARVRALRDASSLSLRELALRCGVSAPMLSQVERGETSPTLVVAAKIASGLGLRLSQLLRLDEDGAVTVIRAGERRHGGSPARGHTFEVMTSPQPGQRAELSRHLLAPGGSTGTSDGEGGGAAPLHEPGSREIALVESGSLTLVCDGERYDLALGDCVTFDSDLPHHFENTGDLPAGFLSVVAAGLRRS